MKALKLMAVVTAGVLSAAVLAERVEPGGVEGDIEAATGLRLAGEEVAEGEVTPVEAKTLSDNVLRGLGWLVETQLPDGGWGPGEESEQMRQRGNEIVTQANVGDTAMAALALLRSGSTPSGGDYATQILSAVNFVCGQIEASDEESLFITDVRGTRLQSKLGTYVDTFLATWLLSDVLEVMPDEASRQRVETALNKTVGKIERHQEEGGQWAMQGWARALAQGMGNKALARARIAGVEVDAAVMGRADQAAREGFDAQTGDVRGGFAGGEAAGIELYARASNVQSLRDMDEMNRRREAVLNDQIANGTLPAAEHAQVEEELAKIAETRGQLGAARGAVAARVDDPGFVAGFGSNGGEEFLSYMNIGEALVAAGGEEWEKWDAAMTENLNRIQNDDGSWSGHHCITGKTFCTSAALLTLMVDRVETTGTGMPGEMRGGESDGATERRSDEGRGGE